MNSFATTFDAIPSRSRPSRRSRPRLRRRTFRPSPRTLGVNILWLMPIHPNGQVEKKGTFGSPYAVRDYYAINPEYGTEADLKNLVSKAHQRGLKVIIDIVANHTAWEGGHGQAVARSGPDG